MKKISERIWRQLADALGNLSEVANEPFNTTSEVVCETLPPQMCRELAAALEKRTAFLKIAAQSGVQNPVCSRRDPHP